MAEEKTATALRDLPGLYDAMWSWDMLDMALNQRLADLKVEAESLVITEGNRLASLDKKKNTTYLSVTERTRSFVVQRKKSLMNRIEELEVLVLAVPPEHRWQGLREGWTSQNAESPVICEEMEKHFGLSTVTGKEFREQLTLFFEWELHPDELKKYISSEQIDRWCVQLLFNRHLGDPVRDAKWYVERFPSVPAFIVRRLLEPGKGGRQTHRAEWVKQKVSDVICLLAMEDLRKNHPEVTQTAAAEEIGRLVNLSSAAVVRAWKKESAAMQLLMRQIELRFTE